VADRSWLLLRALTIVVDPATAQITPRQPLQCAVGQGEAENNIAAGIPGVEIHAVVVEMVPVKGEANDVAGEVAKKTSE